MEDERFAVGQAKFTANFGARAGRRAGSEEVVDDLQRTGGWEQAAGFPFEEGETAVTASDSSRAWRIAGAVAGIASEESGVGAVQGGDHAGSRCRGQHRPREDGRRGVRHRVMDVQNVKPDASRG